MATWRVQIDCGRISGDALGAPAASTSEFEECRMYWKRYAFGKPYNNVILSCVVYILFCIVYMSIVYCDFVCDGAIVWAPGCPGGIERELSGMTLVQHVPSDPTEGRGRGGGVKGEIRESDWGRPRQLLTPGCGAGAPQSSVCFPLSGSLSLLFFCASHTWKTEPPLIGPAADFLWRKKHPILWQGRRQSDNSANRKLNIEDVSNPS